MSLQSGSTLVDFVSEALEASIHQLLYSREVYPNTIFEPRSYLGVRIHFSRHPQVNKYIADTVALAAPALLSGGANALILSIVSLGTSASSISGDVIESFYFTVLPPPPPSRASSSSSSSSAAAASAERSLLADLSVQFRNLVLQLSALSAPLASLPDTSFTLSLQLAPSLVDECEAAPKIRDGLLKGVWRQTDQPDSDATAAESRSVVAVRTVAAEGFRMAVTLLKQRS